MANIQVSMRRKVKHEGRTSNWNIVITILQRAIVRVKRIHIVIAAARLVFALPGFLDATVHLSDFELTLERDRLTIILIRPLYICHTSLGGDVI